MTAPLLLMSMLAAVLFAQAPQSSAPEFDAARAAYVSAAYEQALALLPADASFDSIAVAELRALCYLGLDRQVEAERALERIVRIDPGHAMTDATMSPKLVALFAQVRHRALPGALRDLLGRAMTANARREYETAAEQLALILAVTGDPARRNRDDGFADIDVAARALLAQVEPSLDEDREVDVYSFDDRGVAAPVEIARPIPLWTPTEGSVPQALHQGVLEVIIDERGRVVSASMHRPVHPTYDPTLLEATKTWRFVPATLDDRPVRFRKFIEVIVHPRRSASGG